MNKNLIKITAIMLSALTLSTVATPYSSANGNKNNSYSKKSKQQTKGSKSNPRRPKYSDLKTEPSKPEDSNNQNTGRKISVDSRASAKCRGMIACKEPGYLYSLTEKPEELVPIIKDYPEIIFKLMENYPETVASLNEKHPGIIVSSINNEEVLKKFHNCYPDFLFSLVKDSQEFLVSLAEKNPNFLSNLSKEHPELLIPLAEKHTELLVSLISTNANFAISLAKNAKYNYYLNTPSQRLSHAKPGTKKYEQIVNKIKGILYDHYNVQDHNTSTTEDSKPETQKIEVSKPETTKSETPKIEVSKPETTKIKTSKPETPKTEDQKKTTTSMGRYTRSERRFLIAIEDPEFRDSLAKDPIFKDFELNIQEFKKLKDNSPYIFKVLSSYLKLYEKEKSNSKTEGPVEEYTAPERQEEALNYTDLNTEVYDYYPFDCIFMDSPNYEKSNIEKVIRNLNSVKDDFLYMNGAKFCNLENKLYIKQRKCDGQPVVMINNNIDKNRNWIQYSYDKINPYFNYPYGNHCKTYVNYDKDILVTFELDNDGDIRNLVSIGSSKAFVYDFLLHPEDFVLGTHLYIPFCNHHSYERGLPAIEVMANVESALLSNYKKSTHINTNFKLSYLDILHLELFKESLFEKKD